MVLQADHTLARSGERLGRDHVGRQDLSIHEPDRGCRPNDGLGIFRADRRVDSGDLDNLQVVLGDEGPCRNRVSDCEDGLPIWVTSASEGQPRHVNAVVIDTATDPDAVEKVRSLTRCCSVLVTKGTDLDGLPIQGAPLDESDIAGLVTATETHQEVIAAAVAEHKRRTPSSSLKAPTFPTTPNPADHVPVEDTASGRAFAAANYLAAAWTAWLQTDEERRRRTTRPQTGETPWIMPEHMNSPQLARFPESFAARVHEQPHHESANIRLGPCR